MLTLAFITTNKVASKCGRFNSGKCPKMTFPSQVSSLWRYRIIIVSFFLSFKLLWMPSFKNFLLVSFKISISLYIIIYIIYHTLLFLNIYCRLITPIKYQIWVKKASVPQYLRSVSVTMKYVTWYVRVRATLGRGSVSCTWPPSAVQTQTCTKP